VHFLFIALVASARGLAWLARARAGREPRFRIERVGSRLEELPVLMGSDGGVSGVLVYDADGPSGHPFRTAQSIAVARVHAEGSDVYDAMKTLRDAVAAGVVAGLAVLVVLSLVVVLMTSVAAA
jgi:hypothetical protein